MAVTPAQESTHYLPISAAVSPRRFICRVNNLPLSLVTVPGRIQTPPGAPYRIPEARVPPAQPLKSRYYHRITATDYVWHTSTDGLFCLHGNPVLYRRQLSL